MLLVSLFPTTRGIVGAGNVIVARSPRPESSQLSGLLVRRIEQADCVPINVWNVERRVRGSRSATVAGASGGANVHGGVVHPDARPDRHHRRCQDRHDRSPMRTRRRARYSFPGIRNGAGAVDQRYVIGSAGVTGGMVNVVFATSVPTR